MMLSDRTHTGTVAVRQY